MPLNLVCNGKSQNDSFSISQAHRPVLVIGQFYSIDTINQLCLEITNELPMHYAKNVFEIRISHPQVINFGELIAYIYYL